MAVIQLDRARLVRLLRQTPLQPVASSAVRKLGYAPQARMAAVQFVGGTAVYGYPNLSEEEIRGLLRVMEDTRPSANTWPRPSRPGMTTNT